MFIGAIFAGFMVWSIFGGVSFIFPVLALFGLYSLVFLYFLINHLLIIFDRDFRGVLFGVRMWFYVTLFFSFTNKAKEHRVRWKEYSKFIVNYSEIEKHPAKYHKLWGENYTYAYAIGTAGKK